MSVFAAATADDNKKNLFDLHFATFHSVLFPIKISLLIIKGIFFVYCPFQYI